jgi:hypothetical protein
MCASGNISEKLNFSGDTSLMGEELDLLESDNISELYYDFLRIFTELGTLPSFALRRVVQELTNRILRVLT